MRKPKMSRRMINWYVQLSTYDLRFEPRSTIKSQALADFAADFRSDLQFKVGKEIQWLQDTEETKKGIIFSY